MAEENKERILTLEVGVDDAVKSVADLKTNIKLLKEQLDEAEIGTDKYKETLTQLKENQNALKDAMYATTGTFNDVINGAKGTTKSYNSLVNAMADLKREFRSTTDSLRQQQLADEINQINNELKRLDALQGSFGRNVGNYSSAFKGLSENIDVFGKSTKFASMGIGDMKDATEALSKSPMIATFGILVSVAMQLADTIKENEGVMNSLKKVMEALKPVVNVFNGILENLADWISNIMEKVVPFITSNGLIDKVIDGVIGIGNAIVKYVTAPFKGVIEAIKVFKEKGVKGLGEASKAFLGEMKEGISFKKNFESGQAIADALMDGVKSKKKEVKDTAKEVAEDIGKSLADQIQSDFEKALAIANKKFDEDLKERLENQKFADQLMEEENERFNDELEKFFEEMANMEDASVEHKKLTAKETISCMLQVGTATSSFLSSIADAYESDEKNAKKNAEKVKNIRIASAIINTISGAVGAFTQANETIPPPYGMIIGALNASAVTASGMAEVNKIRSTSVTSSSGSSSSSFTTTAPSVDTSFTNTRTITSASEEDRLNQMANPQRVYILQSDIEASGNGSRTRIKESSF